MQRLWIGWVEWRVEGMARALGQAIQLVEDFGEGRELVTLEGFVEFLSARGGLIDAVYVDVPVAMEVVVLEQQISAWNTAYITKGTSWHFQNSLKLAPKVIDLGTDSDWGFYVEFDKEGVDYVRVKILPLLNQTISFFGASHHRGVRTALRIIQQRNGGTVHNDAIVPCRTVA